MVYKTDIFIINAPMCDKYVVEAQFPNIIEYIKEGDAITCMFTVRQKGEFYKTTYINIPCSGRVNNIEFGISKELFTNIETVTKRIAVCVDFDCYTFIADTINELKTKIETEISKVATNVKDISYGKN